MEAKEALKIAMLVPGCHPPPWGGTQKQAMFLASRLQSLGMSATVISNRRGILPTAAEMTREDLRRARIHEGVRLRYLPGLKSLPAWSFLLSLLIWSILRPRRFHVLHAHTAATGVIACVFGWVTGAKVVVKFPSMKNVAYLRGAAFSRRLRRWVLARRTDRIIALNRDMAAALLDVGIGEHQIALIPNGIDLDGTCSGHEREVAKRSLLGAAEVRVVLFVGRLIPEKALGRLLEVWRALECRSGAMLVVIGEGPMRQELEAKAMDASVRFLGHRSDVADFYAIADLFVLPSRTEGMSNALLEAMAAGVPVVASNVDGNREVIEHGRCGFLADWDNTAACAGLISFLLADPELCRKVGEAGRKRVRRFAMEEVARSYTELYYQLMGHENSRGAS